MFDQIDPRTFGIPSHFQNIWIRHFQHSSKRWPITSTKWLSRSKLEREGNNLAEMKPISNLSATKTNKLQVSYISYKNMYLFDDVKITGAWFQQIQFITNKTLWSDNFWANLEIIRERDQLDYLLNVLLFLLVTKCCSLIFKLKFCCLLESRDKNASRVLFEYMQTYFTMKHVSRG